MGNRECLSGNGNRSYPRRTWIGRHGIRNCPVSGPAKCGRNRDPRTLGLRGPRDDRRGRIHLSSPKSNKDSSRVSARIAARKRPSGDHAGECRPWEPGSTSTRFAFRCKTWIDASLPVSGFGVAPKAIRSPAGDQTGSASAIASGIATNSAEPETAIVPARHLPIRLFTMHEICVPSGDHRGIVTLDGPGMRTTGLEQAGREHFHSV